MTACSLVFMAWTLMIYLQFNDFGWKEPKKVWETKDSGYRVASMLDKRHHMEVTHLVAMCNYRANRLACDAADRAMQTCGGVGYSRHMPFEHIYRHHRRYRITEGSEEIQMRKVASNLFGFGAPPDRR